MQRYRHLNAPCCRSYGWLSEKEDGEWMRFEDHQATIAAKDAEIARMTQQLATVLLREQRRVNELEAALRRMDSLNDNPACFNADIQKVLNIALGKLPCDQCDDPDCPVNQGDRAP